MFKEIIVHEIIITLVIFLCKALIFIQIYRLYAGKVKISLIIPVDQLLVGAKGRRTGSQTKHAVWFHDYLR